MDLRLTTLPDRPAPVFLALTAACVLAFGATVPLPRVDDQLVGSDGVRYYVYLPSVLLDGDLDFTDEYRQLYRSHPRTAAHLVADLTATGLPANRFGIGPAVLWTPFFIAAHLLAVLLEALGWTIGTDGTSAFYQAPVLAGSILYGGAGAWLCFRAALRVASPKAALAATLLIVLAGNPIYYLTVEPSMSHPLSLFASSAFFYLWLTTRDRRRRERLALGALAGLMALIRPQDGLLLLLPIADDALSAMRSGGRALIGWLVASLSAAAAALVVFTPQLVVWKLLNGDFLRSGYSQEFDVLFRSPLPRLLDVLFSAQRGLFTWHPVFFFALAGLCLLVRHDRRLAALAGAGFAIQWLVVSSWHDWTQGDAFGGRMFIVCSPIFALGLAPLLDAAGRRWSGRRLLAGGAALVVLNLLLLVHYRVELLALARPITFIDLAFGRFLPF